MQIHVYGIVLLLVFAPCLNAARVRPGGKKLKARHSNVTSENSPHYGSALQVEENVTDDGFKDRSTKDVIFAILADPQIGMFHAYDGLPGSPRDASHAAEFHEEEAVFKKITAHLAKFRDELSFVMVSGDMQQYYPTGDNKFVPAGTEKKQRGAVKEALKNLPNVRYLPGNHDIDDKVTTPVLNDYKKAYGDDYYSFTLQGVNFIVLNSQVYYDTDPNDKKMQDHKMEQGAFFSRELAKPNNVVLTHIPPFIESLNEAAGWGNWHDRNMFPQFLSAPNFPKQWFCGHLHKNAVNKVRDAGNVEVVVTSSCASTMDWGGKADFKNAKEAAAITTIPASGLPAAVGGQIFGKGGIIGPGDQRSGLRIVKCNAGKQYPCEHKWFTLAEFERVSRLASISF